MKQIFLNLKRFDVLPKYGGVNRLTDASQWGSYIVEQTQNSLKKWVKQATFVDFFPEAHLITAKLAQTQDSPVQLGCQGVYREDTAVKGNFGAFTTNRPASAMVQLGCAWTIIGHCEERMDKAGLLEQAGVSEPRIVNQVLNQEVLAAQKAGLSVLYCIGEKEEEQVHWQDVLSAQLEQGLLGADRKKLTIAYEPIWSIGPGKVPADREYISKVSKFLKSWDQEVPVVYGGGLKTSNASMLASIPEIDGGLIALTRFSGEVGFYPQEYLEIVKLYLEK